MRMLSHSVRIDEIPIFCLTWYNSSTESLSMNPDLTFTLSWLLHTWAATVLPLKVASVRPAGYTHELTVLLGSVLGIQIQL